MSVCALLVNYHNALDIAGAVASVLADNGRTEVVVVDNSDDDEEWELLKEQLPATARMVRAPGNLGFGGGCNLAMEHTSADFLFLVNPDVRLLAGCTDKLLACLHRDASLAAVSPLQFLDPDCRWRLPPSWLPTAIRAWATERALREPSVAARLAAATRAENLRFWRTRTAVRQRALSGAALMVRRASLEAGQSLFDPRYFMYFEDTDLCMRLRKKGWGLAIEPSARAIHSWRHQPHKGSLMAASAPLYFDKFFPKGESWSPRTVPAPLVEQNLHPSFQHFPARGVEVALDWGDDWVFELSPSPLLQPAVAMLGKGTHVSEPLAALSHFEMGPVYGRLGRVSALNVNEPSMLFYWANSCC